MLVYDVFAFGCGCVALLQQKRCSSCNNVVLLYYPAHRLGLVQFRKVVGLWILVVFVLLPMGIPSCSLYLERSRKSKPLRSEPNTSTSSFHALISIVVCGGPESRFDAAQYTHLRDFAE